LISPFPTTCFSSSADSSVRCYDVELQRESSVWHLPSQAALTCLAISDDGRSVVTGGWDRCFRLIDVRQSDVNSRQNSSNTRITFRSHSNTITALNWSPSDPHHLVSSSYDGTVKVWDIRSQIPLMTLKQKPQLSTEMQQMEELRVLDVQWIAAGRGGTGRIISGGTDKRLHYYQWEETNQSI